MTSNCSMKLNPNELKISSVHPGQLQHEHEHLRWKCLLFGDSTKQTLPNVANNLKATFYCISFEHDVTYEHVEITLCKLCASNSVETGRFYNSSENVYLCKQETRGKLHGSSRGSPSQLLVGMQLVSQQREQTLQYNCISMLFLLSVVISLHLVNALDY